MWVGILRGRGCGLEVGILPDCEGFVESVETCAPRPGGLEGSRPLASLGVVLAEGKSVSWCVVSI